MKTETGIAGTGRRLVEAASEHAKEYVDAGADAVHAMSDGALQIGRKADGYVRRSPWVAIGTAASAGLLLGFLLRSRWKS